MDVEPSSDNSNPPNTRSVRHQGDELFNHLINSKGFSIAELIRIIAVLTQQSYNFYLPGVWIAVDIRMLDQRPVAGLLYHMLV
jgi:hypothetical protein